MKVTERQRASSVSEGTEGVQCEVRTILLNKAVGTTVPYTGLTVIPRVFPTTSFAIIHISETV